MAADGGSGLATIVRFLSKTWGMCPGAGGGVSAGPPRDLTPAGLSPNKLISGLSPAHLVQFGGVGHEGEPLQAQVEPSLAPLLQREPLRGKRVSMAPPAPPAPPAPTPTLSSTRAFSTSPKSSFILGRGEVGEAMSCGLGGQQPAPHPPPQTSARQSGPPPHLPSRSSWSGSLSKSSTSISCPGTSCTMNWGTGSVGGDTGGTPPPKHSQAGDLTGVPLSSPAVFGELLPPQSSWGH